MIRHTATEGAGYFCFQDENGRIRITATFKDEKGFVRDISLSLRPDQIKAIQRLADHDSE